MIRTVAVGTDGSATAGRALEAAFELAERFEAKLVVLSAYDSTAAYRATAGAAIAGMAVPVDTEWANASAERVKGILEEARRSATSRGIECETEASDGDPAEVLVTLAAHHDADVLVIGNRGMQRRILGSVPNTVTHKAPCSVFVVKTT